MSRNTLKHQWQMILENKEIIQAQKDTMYKQLEDIKNYKRIIFDKNLQLERKENIIKRQTINFEAMKQNFRIYYEKTNQLTIEIVDIQTQHHLEMKEMKCLMKKKQSKALQTALTTECDESKANETDSNSQNTHLNQSIDSFKSLSRDLEKFKHTHGNSKKRKLHEVLDVVDENVNKKRKTSALESENINSSQKRSESLIELSERSASIAELKTSIQINGNTPRSLSLQADENDKKFINGGHLQDDGEYDPKDDQEFEEYDDQEFEEYDD